MVAADAAGADDDDRRGDLEGTDDELARALAAFDGRGLEDVAGDAGDGAGGADEPRDAVAEFHDDAPRRGMVADAADEGFDGAGTRAPGDVKARHGVAVAVGERAAALGPADDREPAHALGVQPGMHLARGEVDIGLGHLARPVVLGPVELRRAHPVLQRQLAAVADLQPALLGTVDEEQAAERPEGLPAERVLALLIEQDDAFSGIAKFRGSNQPRQPAAHHDHIGILGHARSPRRFAASLVEAGPGFKAPRAVGATPIEGAA